MRNEDARAVATVVLPVVFVVLQIAVFAAVSALSMHLPRPSLASAIYHPASVVLIVTLFIWSHALYIVVIAAWGSELSAGAVLRASVLLAVPIFAFAALNALNGGEGCLDGVVQRRALFGLDVPFLPWVWIGWGVAMLTALPTQCLACASGQRLAQPTLSRRMLAIVACFPPVWLFGALFQLPPRTCDGPVEMWGLLEGGMITVPLLALFLFFMSASLGWLWPAARRF